MLSIGRIGLEPTTPEGNGFTDRRVTDYTTCRKIHDNNNLHLPYAFYSFRVAPFMFWAMPSVGVEPTPSVFHTDASTELAYWAYTYK